MNRQSTPVTRRRRRTLAFSLTALVLSVGLCYVLYEYSPAGLVIWWFLTAQSIEERAKVLVPEYDRINDELWESLPMYPRATLLPESQQRGGPGSNLGLIGGPAYPRFLLACFSTNDTAREVDEFYRKALQQNGWRVTQDAGAFNKGQACVTLSTCWEEVETGDTLVYQIRVYHDINRLLGFPHIPKIIYWLDEIEHCP